VAHAVDGGRAVECESIEAARELNLAGRETIRRMTETIYSDLYADREAGKHNMTSDQMRLRAHAKATSLVAETAPKVKRRPLR
jgi:hypothetical protein